MKKKALSTFEAAGLLGLSPYTIRLWIEKGLLPAYRTPGGHRRIRAEELNAFLKSHKMPVPELRAGEKASFLFIGGGRGDEDFRRLKKILSKFRPLASSGALEAGFLLLKERPRLLVFDLDTKNVCWKELGALVRKHADISHVQMVGITKALSAGLVSQAQERGFFDVLQKPVSKKEFDKVLLAAFSSSELIS